MSAQTYLATILPLIERLGTEEMGAIERAGEAVAAAVGGGGRVWMARTSHALHDEATGRAGGLMAVHVLHDPVAIQPGDAVIAGTNAGTTFLAVETARLAKARGATVIALTQMPYETHPDLILEHPTGRRLHEEADIVIDLGGAVGDGELPLIPGEPALLPSSGATGVVALWMVFGVAVERLVAAGTPPLVWQSIQLPGAAERNAPILAAYRQTGVGYARGTNP